MKDCSDAYLIFGLMNDSSKNSSYLHTELMCYSERLNEYGMGKVVKGS